MSKSKPTETSALESHLGFWLRFVSNHVSARFESLLAAHDISVTEWVAMRVLYQQAGSTHAELIEALGMTKGAVSKIISRLETKALAERFVVDGNMREQVLQLTRAGNRLVPTLAALADENDVHFFGHLKESQCQSLVILMQDLVTHHQLKKIPTD